MRDYGQVQTSFWGHPKIMPLTDDSKLLALYLLTGPHSNGLGCYRLPMGYVSADLNWDIERVSKGFRYLIESLFCIRDNRTEWVLLPDYLEWNQISNPKVAIARIKEARECPKSSIIWPAMVESLRRYALKHMPKNFISLIEKEWLPIAHRIPEKTKTLLLQRDEHKCAECGSINDLTIDHIKPIAYGGNHNLDNLRILCRSCNSKWFGNPIETLSKQEQEQEQEQEKNKKEKPIVDFFEGDKPKKKPANGTRLPKDWQIPDDWIAWTQQNTPHINITETADIFRDYWIAQPGIKGRKTDWLATWRNWCRKVSAGKPNGAKQSTASRFMENLKNADRN